MARLDKQHSHRATYRVDWAMYDACGFVAADVMQRRCRQMVRILGLAPVTLQLSTLKRGGGYWKESTRTVCIGWHYDIDTYVYSVAVLIHELAHALDFARRGIVPRANWHDATFRRALLDVAAAYDPDIAAAWAAEYAKAGLIVS